MLDPMQNPIKVDELYKKPGGGYYTIDEASCRLLSHLETGMRDAFGNRVESPHEDLPANKEA